MEQAQNYRDSGPIKKVEGDNEFYYILNESGGTAGKGIPYVLNMNAAATTIGGVSVVVAQYSVQAPATLATSSSIICVPVADIANGAWGWVQTKGYVPYAVTTGTVAANDQLEVLNTGVAFIDQGTNGGAAIGANSCGIALVLVTTDVWTIYLFGLQVVVAAA